MIAIILLVGFCSFMIYGYIDEKLIKIRRIKSIEEYNKIKLTYDYVLKYINNPNTYIYTSIKKGLGPWVYSLLNNTNVPDTVHSYLSIVYNWENGDIFKVEHNNQTLFLTPEQYSYLVKKVSGIVLPPYDYSKLKLLDTYHEHG